MSVLRWPALLLSATLWGCASHDGAEPVAVTAPLSIASDAGAAAASPIGAPAATIDAGVNPLVKLERDADGVLRSYCIGCHAWTTSTAVRSSTACGGRGSRLVVPRDLRHSPLYGKITGDTVCGGPMPPAGGLPPAAVAAIRAWILEGAPIEGRVCTSCLVASPEKELEVNDLNRDD